MSIRYEPKKLLQRLAGKRKIERLVKDNLTVNRAALNAISELSYLGKRQLEFVALEVIRGYKEKAEELRDEGLTRQESAEEVLENKKLLVQRVQNATVNEVTKRVQEKYRGEFYVWLPSTAENPDPEHQRRYGKTYQLGKGEAPGERFGCRCGMEILVDEKTLRLG